MNSYGTESDKVNCSFYYKIGACRHGDRCSRKHTRPNFSPTVVLFNIYANPKKDALSLKDEQLQQHFDMFYTDMFIEMSKYGYIDELVICDNICDHLVGDVFVKYRADEDAKKAQLSLDNRFYAARPIYAELSPVVSFRDALCKQHDDGLCARGKMCNFMHLKRPTLQLLKDLKEAQVIMYRDLNKRFEIRGRDINEMNFGSGGQQRGDNRRGYGRDYRNDRSNSDQRDNRAPYRQNDRQNERLNDDRGNRAPYRQPERRDDRDGRPRSYDRQIERPSHDQRTERPSYQRRDERPTSDRNTRPSYDNRRGSQERGMDSHRQSNMDERPREYEERRDNPRRAAAPMDYNNRARGNSDRDRRY